MIYLLRISSLLRISKFGFRNCVSLRLDLDLARLGRLVLGQADLQDAVLQARLDSALIDGVRQRHGARELAEAAFLAMLHALVHGRRLALALEGKLIVIG